MDVEAWAYAYKNTSRTSGWDGAISMSGLTSSMPTKTLAPSGLLTTVKSVWRMSLIVSFELLQHEDQLAKGTGAMLQRAMRVAREEVIKRRAAYQYRTTETRAGILPTRVESCFTLSGSNAEKV